MLVRVRYSTSTLKKTSLPNVHAQVPFQESGGFCHQTKHIIKQKVVQAQSKDNQKIHRKKKKNRDREENAKTKSKRNAT